MLGVRKVEGDQVVAPGEEVVGDVRGEGGDMVWGEEEGEWQG